MNVQESLKTIQTQIALSRTPKGRVITDFGKQSLQSVIDDTANYSTDVVRCKNCGMIISVLLTAEGCPNCGGLDFDAKIQ